MATRRLSRYGFLWSTLMALGLSWLPGVGTAGPAQLDDLKLPPALEKPNPETIEDLRAIEAHVKKVVAKVMPAVVNVKPQAGNGQGSGVVISEDGYVLTAAHVAPTPKKPYFITFPDGKQVKAESLGSNGGPDDGLLKITEEGKYPFCEMGKSSDLKKGEWCIAIGHPGGLQKGRSPPVRLGRISGPPGNWVTTEATLVGGDSGGPLFDMHGKVIAIHSRIGNPLTANMHVPVDTYKTDWEKLVAGERWGGPSAPKGPPPPVWLGIIADAEYDGPGAKVGEVVIGSPAEKAGLKVGDMITSISGKSVANFDALRLDIQSRKAGDEITLEVRRGAKTLTLKAVLDKAG